MKIEGLEDKIFGLAVTSRPPSPRSLRYCDTVQLWEIIGCYHEQAGFHNLLLPDWTLGGHRDPLSHTYWIG